MEVYIKKIIKVLMTKGSSWKTKGMLTTLLLAPGSLTSVMGLATLWAPLVQKWSLYEIGVEGVKNGGWLEI